MDTYVPRSRRLGLNPENDGPFEGIPEHLFPQLHHWTAEMLKFRGTEWDRKLALQLRVRVGGHRYPSDDLMAAAKENEVLWWDVVEAVIRTDDVSPTYGPVMRRISEARDQLHEMLNLAGSIYTVSDDGQIEEKVTEEAADTYARAVVVEDPISDHLRQAWGHAYGRNPDASDAWDHAIKAVEAMLYPVVSPNNTKATLGSMLAEMNNSPQKFRCAYLGRNHDHATENVTPSLWVIWRNPDRHGSGTVQAPTLDEARAVVTLTAALVQTHRDSANGLVYLAPQNPRVSARAAMNTAYEAHTHASPTPRCRTSRANGR